MMKNMFWHPFNKTKPKKIYFLTTISLPDNGKLHKTFLGQPRQLRNFDSDYSRGNCCGDGCRHTEVPEGGWGAIIDFRCALNNTEDKRPRGRLLESSLAVSNKIKKNSKIFFFLQMRIIILA